MQAFLPSAFIVLSGGALLFAISFVWAALRALLGGTSELHVSESAAMRQRHELLDEKEAVLKGKLSEHDFRRLELEFRARAKRILKQLDDELREHREQAKTLLERELKRPLSLETDT